MADEPSNLLLEYMRRFDAKLDRFSDDLHNLKTRMTYVEEGLAGVNRRLDQVDGRLDHIEKRLELEPRLPGFRE
jgi:hypothetical protein